MLVSCECCVLSVRNLNDGSITRQGESNRVYVSLSVIRCNNNPLHLQWVGKKFRLIKLQHVTVVNKRTKVSPHSFVKCNFICRRNYLGLLVCVLKQHVSY